MPSLEMWHIGVFAREPFLGNPAAVGFLDSDVPSETLQRIARCMNLSETVFISPSQSADADYHARIFTTRRELSFAVHPSLAAAYGFLVRQRSWDGCSGQTVRQGCGIGIVEIDGVTRPSGHALFVGQQAPSIVPVDIDWERLADALGCGVGGLASRQAHVVSTGVRWLLIEAHSVSTVAALAPDPRTLGSLTKTAGAVGVSVYSRMGARSGNDVHLRTFAPAEGIAEDPVCGSCHGAIAGYLSASDDRVERLLREGGALRFDQGDELGLPGTSEVIRRDGVLYVGGSAHVTLKGRITWAETPR
jgi:PhzF family phenazine biosynthesis protein